MGGLVESIKAALHQHRPTEYSRLNYTIRKERVGAVETREGLGGRRYKAGPHHRALHQLVGPEPSIAHFPAVFIAASLPRSWRAAIN